MGNTSPFFMVPSVRCECGFRPAIIQRQPQDEANEFRFKCPNKECVEYNEEYIVKMPYLVYKT